jgi:hypothetical protein
MAFDRREFLKISAGVAGAPPWAPDRLRQRPRVAKARPKVVIVGAGFGGATCARYLKMWDPKIEVTVIEPNDKFVSCPFSNTVLAGINKMEDITFTYDHVKKAVDTGFRTRSPASTPPAARSRPPAARPSAMTAWFWPAASNCCSTRCKGYDAEAQKTIKHAWKAGPQTGVPCASSWKPCPTAAPSSCRCPWPRTAARPAPTSAPARSPPTSRRPSPSPRSSSSTATRTSPPRRACSWQPGRSTTATAPPTA